MLILGVGILYCFFGGKVYQFFHALICGLYVFLFLVLLIGILNITAGIIIGAAFGLIVCYDCFRAGTCKAFILGTQLGLVLVNLIFPLMTSSLQKYEGIIGLGLSIAVGIIAIFIRGPIVIKSTAIIGGHNISISILLLAGKPSFLTEFGVPYVFFIGIWTIFSVAGILFQYHKKYHLTMEEKDSELNQNLYDHHAVDINNTADSQY